MKSLHMLTKCGCLFLEKSWELWALPLKLLGSVDQIVMLWPSMLWLMSIFQFFYIRIIYKKHVPSRCAVFSLSFGQWSTQMRSHQICSCYVPYIFLCPILLAMQDIPARTIAYPSQREFKDAATGQVRDGIKFLCKAEVLLPGFRRNYFCPFTEEEYYTGRLTKDCMTISLGVGSRLSCSLSVLHLWVLSSRLTKDSKLIVLPIQNSLKLWTSAVPKSFCKWSI